MRTTVLAAAVLAVAGGAIVGARAQAQAPAVGVVIEVSGKWTNKRAERALTAGDLLHAGDVVVTSRATSGEIAIALFDSGQIWRQGCSSAKPCEGTYAPPTKAAQKTGMWALVSSYWRPERKFPPAFAAVRSGRTLPPAVVQAASRIDLGRVLDPLGDGRYTLELSGAITSPGDAPAITRQVRVESDQPVWVEGIHPGLYILRAFDGNGTTVGGPTGLLVAKDAAAANRWVAELNDAMQAWTGITLATREQMIIRLLYALASEQTLR